MAVTALDKALLERQRTLAGYRRAKRADRIRMYADPQTGPALRA